MRVLLVAVLPLLLCVSTVRAQPRTPPGKVKVGMLLTLSGAFATAGEDGRKGVEAALAEPGVREALEVLYADSRNEPAAAISEFRRMVEGEGAVAIYTHRGPIGMSLNPVSRAAGVPLLGCVGNKDFAAENEFGFQLWPRSDEEGQFMADEFLKRGFRRVVLLYTQDDWTASVSHGFRDTFTASGGRLLLDQSVLPGEADFRTLLMKAKQLKPDAVYMNMLLPQLGAMVKQARDLQVGGEFFSNFYMTKRDVVESAGKAALEGVKYVEVDSDLPVLKGALGGDPADAPPALTISSYLGTKLLAQAARDAQGGTRAEMQQALLRQKEIRTADHVYPILDRYVKFPLVMKMMHGGRGGKEVRAAL